MNRDEIIRLLKKELSLEKGCLEAAMCVYETTRNPFIKIRYKFVIEKYTHSYITLSIILDKIEEGRI